MVDGAIRDAQIEIITKLHDALYDAIHRLSVHDAKEWNREFPGKHFKPPRRDFIAGKDE